MIWDHLTPEDSKRAKKSLIIVACCTLIFATFEFKENILRLFGLELIVSQDKIVQIGQYACLLLVLIFCLRELPNYIAKLAKMLIESQQNSHKEIQERFWDEYHQPEEFDGNPETEFKDLQNFLKQKLENRRHRYERLLFLFSALNIAVVDVLFPIALAALAFFNPYFLKADFLF